MFTKILSVVACLAGLIFFFTCYVDGSDGKIEDQSICASEFWDAVTSKSSLIRSVSSTRSTSFEGEIDLALAGSRREIVMEIESRISELLKGSGFEVSIRQSESDNSSCRRLIGKANGKAKIIFFRVSSELSSKALGVGDDVQANILWCTTSLEL